MVDLRVIGSVLVGVGFALGLCAQPILIMSAVPPDAASSANGINALFRTVGTSISIAGIVLLIPSRKASQAD